MSNKLSLVVLLILALGVATLGWKTSVLGVSTSASAEKEQITLATDPSPLRPGKAKFIIKVQDKEGKAVDNAKVSFDLNMTTMNMGTQKGEASAQGNGQYVAQGNLTMLGPWRVRTQVVKSDGSKENKDFVVNVR